MRAPTIAILMTCKGALQEKVLQGIYSHFKKTLPNAEFYELDAKGPNDETIKGWLAEITVEYIDLVITIGDRPLTLLLDDFKNRRFHVPTIFCCVSSEIAEQAQQTVADGAEYLSGIFVEPMDNKLPIQLMMRAISGSRRLLLPYRGDAKGGRVSHEVEQIKKYCEDRGITVTTIELDKVKKITDLRGAITSNDGVVIPEGGVTPLDVEKIGTLCEEEKVPLLAGGQGLQKRGGIYGFKDDFIYIGVKVAEMGSAIVLNNKKPIEIPIQEIEHSRKLHNINAKSMAKCGVFIADDVVSSLDKKIIKNQDLPTAIIGMSYINETSFSYGLHMLTGQLLAQEDNTFFCIWDYNAWWENKDFMRKHVKYVSKKNVETMVFFDDRMAHLVWKEVHRTGTKFPPIIIASFEDEIVDEKWHVRARAEGYTVIRIVLPSPDPIVQLDLLYESMESLKTLTVFLKCDPDKMPLFIEKRVEKLRNECTKRGIELKTIGAFSYGELIDIVNELTPESSDAYLCFQDFFCGKVGAYLLQRCLEMGIPVSAGGLSWSQIAPLCYGVDLVEFRKFLCDVIKRTVGGKHTPEDDYFKFENRHDVYRFCFNQLLCEKLGLKFASPLLQQLTHQCKDIMYERNAAACLQAIGVDKDGKSLMTIPARRKKDGDDTPIIQ